MNSTNTPIGFLGVRQSKLTDAASLNTKYDLALGVLGWEERATFALKFYYEKSDDLRLIRFHSQEEGEIRAKDRCLTTALDIISDHPHKVEMINSSVEYDSNFSFIEELICSKFKSMGRPVSLVIDMSCIPKRYMLFILGMGFKRDYISKIDFLYSEGTYENIPASDVSPARGLVSVGEWNSAQVPYLEANNYVPDQRDLFVSLGAEITLAIPTVQRFEPATLRMYQTSDSHIRVPAALISAEEPALQTLTQSRSAEVHSFDISDVIGLAQHILRVKERSTTCLAIGTKPHALALGLAALADDEIQVVCRSPTSYALGNVKPNGTLLQFSVEDRFEPTSYWSE